MNSYCGNKESREMVICSEQQAGNKESREMVICSEQQAGNKESREMVICSEQQAGDVGLLITVESQTVSDMNTTCTYRCLKPGSERTWDAGTGIGTGAALAMNKNANESFIKTVPSHGERYDERNENVTGRAFYGKHFPPSAGNRRVKVLPSSASVDLAYVEEVTYTRENLSDCFRRNGHITVFTKTLRIDFSRRSEYVFGLKTCTVEVLASRGQTLIAKSKTTTVHRCNWSNYVVISAERNRIGDLWYYSCAKEEAFSDDQYYFESGGKNVTVELHMWSGDIFFVLNVFAVDHVGIESVQLSPTQGYIQNPGNDRGERPLTGTDTWLTVQPPASHVTLLSVRRVQVNRNDVGLMSVYGGGKESQDLVWKVSGHSELPLPRVFNEREIHFHQQSPHTSNGMSFARKYTGIAVLYSFHARSHRPSRVQGGLWNCSVPEWPEFQRHFLCNLDQECHGDEDEVECFYKGHCGEERLTLNSRCYNYVKPAKPISWVKANEDCMIQGGYLASLNTPSEWKVVTKFAKIRRNHERIIFVGIRAANLILPSMYKKNRQWADGSVAYFSTSAKRRDEDCGVLEQYNLDTVVMDVPCARPLRAHYICELPSHEEALGKRAPAPPPLPPAAPTAAPRIPSVTCPAGHLTLDFLACDERSECWASRGEFHPRRGRRPALCASLETATSTSSEAASLPAMFSCASYSQRVPYSLVCDHRRQCADGSDETFCVFPPCPRSTPARCAVTGECIVNTAYCDGAEQCGDGSDESDCGLGSSSARHVLLMDPPAVVEYLRPYRNAFVARPVTRRQKHAGPTSVCPSSHFQCPGDGYCLPVYLRCNGVDDCPGREDEAGCERATCPGFYLCRGSKVCLLVSSVCDGFHQCPQRDDELYCHFPPCPSNCTCYGLAYACSGTFDAGRYRRIRYLDATGSGMNSSRLSENTMLVHLSLASCGMRAVGDLSFPNLRSLDLRDNLLAEISVERLSSVTNLKLLVISGNPLQALFSLDANATLRLRHLDSIDLSRAAYGDIDLSIFAAFPNLRSLNISHSAVKRLRRRDESALKKIRVLDFRGSVVTDFERRVMAGLDELEAVFAESYKLCCPAVLPPKFNSKNCHAPFDRLSSCDNLLASAAHRIALALCCCFALAGNVASVTARVFVARSRVSTSADVFVTHLAVGDALMGVSVSVVAVADRLYRGRYALEDAAWRQSGSCSTVGFLHLLSSHLSASVVFLITLDAFASSFEPARRLSLRSGAAHVACVLAWAACAALAALPLLPTTTHWEFFGQTAVCLPLLVTAEHFSHPYKAPFASTIVVFNALSASLTAVGLACVYAKVQKHPPNYLNGGFVTPSAKRSHDARHGRGVFSPCALNVACWLPLCALAALAQRGTPMPDEVHVHAGLIVLPVGSALRPFLHVLEVREERRKRERVERLRARINAQRQRKS